MARKIYNQYTLETKSKMDYDTKEKSNVQRIFQIFLNINYVLCFQIFLDIQIKF